MLKLEADGQTSSRRPLLSAQNRKSKLQFTQKKKRKADNKVDKTVKNIVWSDEPQFSSYDQTVGLKFDINNMKPWIHHPFYQFLRLVVM